MDSTLTRLARTRKYIIKREASVHRKLEKYNTALNAISDLLKNAIEHDGLFDTEAVENFYKSIEYLEF